MRKTFKRTYLAGPEATAIAGGGTAKGMPASAAIRGAAARYSVFPALGLRSAVNRKTPCGIPSLQQFCSQSMPAACRCIGHRMPISVIAMPLQ